MKNSQKFGISFAWLLAFSFAISVFIFFTELLYSNFGIELSIDIFNNAAKNFINDTNIYIGFLLVVFLAPLIEEFIFRYMLNLEKKSIKVGVSILYIFLYQNYILFITNEYLNLIVLASSVIAIYYTLNHFLNEDNIRLMKSKYSKVIIYSSSILFALIHLSNLKAFHIIELPYYLISLSILFFLGLFAAFVRINISFWAAVAFHGLWNFIAFIFIMG